MTAKIKVQTRRLVLTNAVQECKEKYTERSAVKLEAGAATRRGRASNLKLEVLRNSSHSPKQLFYIIFIKRIKLITHPLKLISF
jgi:hypothetical protein